MTLFCLTHALAEGHVHTDDAVYISVTRLKLLDISTDGANISNNSLQMLYIEGNAFMTFI